MIRILFLIHLAGLALMHNLAITFYFYWQYPWFDILDAFLGRCSGCTGGGYAS
jgi:hypothetical protein